MFKTLLAFAHDAASANMVIAYIKLYEKSYSHIKAYFGSSVAKNLYLQHIPEYIYEDDDFSFTKDCTVITGTSGINSSYEMNILRKAKLSNAQKSIVVVDNTSNFEMRFLLNNQVLDEKFAPDEIWIFDKVFKSNIKYLNEKLVYKENIYQIYLNKIFKNQKPKFTNDFVKKYKFQYLVILSEYLYEFYGLSYGFTEYDMVENILKTIDELNIKIPIFLKLHPKENKNKFNILLRKFSHLVITCEDCKIQELIYYAKAIIGINSSVFIECNLYNKPVYSFQIGNYTFNKINISRSLCVQTIGTQNDLEKILIHFS